jgi:hypothetical protein
MITIFGDFRPFSVKRNVTSSFLAISDILRKEAICLASFSA